MSTLVFATLASASATATPERHAERAERLAPEAQLQLLCQLLSVSTGLSLTPELLTDSEQLVRGFEEGLFSLAWAPPLIALELQQRRLAEPLVVVQRGQRLGYHAALFSRANAPFRQASELVGSRVAWVSQDSTSGYVAPRWHLRTLGMNPDEMFAEQRFYGDHDAVVRAVLEGEADVGATHVGVDPLTGELESAPWLSYAGAEAVRVWFLIGPIPGDVVVCGAQVRPTVRQRLAAVFLALPPEARPLAEAVFQAHQFDPAPPGHLDLLRGLSRSRDKSGS